MKTLKLHISEIKVNPINPREITEAMFNKLIVSLLTFPKMLQLREIVIDKDRVILAGNMRYRALSSIADLPIADLKQLIDTSHKAKKFPPIWKESLFKYWVEWQKSPTVEVKDGSDLTEDEQKEFLIKDNVSYGEFEQDILANEWDVDDIDDWGVYTWVEEIKDEPEEKEKPIRYLLEVDCKTESERQTVEELLETRGYKVKRKGGE